jgi:hypothetical protein
MKKCNKCGHEKPRSEFSKSKATKDGLTFRCKECDKQYYIDNADKIMSYRETYKEKRAAIKQEKKTLKELADNEEKAEKARIKAEKQATRDERYKNREREYREKNKDKIAAQSKAYREKNKGKIAEHKRKKYYLENHEIVQLNKQERAEKKAANTIAKRAQRAMEIMQERSARKQERLMDEQLRIETKKKQEEELKNKTSKVCKVCKIEKDFSGFTKSFKGNRTRDGYKTICIDCNNEAIADRKQKRREQTLANYELYKENLKERRATDPLFNLIERTRNMIGNCIREGGYTKKAKSYQILGCTFEQFHDHLANQFVEGMSWDNRNEWHIDHIVPVSFATTEEELLLLNHYTNLRPLWARDNIAKSDKLLDDSINHPIYQQIIQKRK